MRSWISVVALTRRNRPPAMRIRSRQDTSTRQSENSGAVSDMTQLMLASSASRMTSASDRPMTRARSRCAAGSLSDRMAMKIRLSTPRTTSSAISVRRPTQTVGSLSHSMARSVGHVGLEEQPLDLGELGARRRLGAVDRGHQLLDAARLHLGLHGHHEGGAELVGDHPVELVDAVLGEEELAQARLGFGRSAL